MDRNEMMSFEEMENAEGDVGTDAETICYRIERVIHDMMESDGGVDYLLLSYATDDILWDCYQAECVSSGLGLIYYNKENHMNYEMSTKITKTMTNTNQSSFCPFALH